MPGHKSKRLILAALLIICARGDVSAQAKAEHLPEERDASGSVTRNETITVSFTEAVETPAQLKTLIYFEDSDDRVVQYWADANHPTGTGFDNVVNLTNFRTDPSDDKAAINLASLVPKGKKRDFIVVVKDVKFPGEEKGKRVQTSVAVRSPAEKPPRLFMLPVNADNREALTVQPFGITRQAILNKFGSSPEKITVAYDFAERDTVPDTDVKAASVKADPQNPNALLIEPSEAIPRRPEPYTVSVKLPAAELRGSEETAKDFKIPDDAEFLEVSREVKLIPNAPKRADSEFYFEASFNSTVNQQNRSRTNAGIFGLNIKPTIEPLTYNVSGAGEGAPFWLALRPLLEADVDTQSPRDSKSPNRIKFGTDFEYGQNVGLAGGPRFLPYFIWLNGLHHESDRDFKLQTLYWHTEFIPHFLNFEKTQEQTLHQFRYPGGTLNKEKRGLQPLVSAYHFRPSIGYDLGGTIRRDLRAIDAPTENISRLLFKLDMGVELKRLVSFKIEDTYYFLENADRRRNRNYLETRLEFNTGYLFRIDLGGLQNAITFKFQRGDQPPTFKSVNAFSAGFKIFQ